MKKNHFLILNLLLFLSVFSFGQKMSWRDYSDLADKSLKNLDYAVAAKNYKMAWQKKKSKTEFLDKAANCYNLVKNYKDAAGSYELLAKKTKEFPQAGLEYARALKQDGSYEKAMKAFETYLNGYQSEDKPQVKEIVNREIEGCQKAMSWIVDSSASVYKISFPGLTINSNFTEFAPIPFGENTLYFSSNRKGKAKIYKSEWDGNSWSRPQVPDIFPKDEKDHFGNGSFSEDYHRFYFTKCIEIQGKDGPVSKCDIYVVIKRDEKWSEPIKLREYINDSIATTTQPNVSNFGNKEVLYFSSDRPGGYGGMDIWYAERDLSTDDIDFTYPQNCGPAINTFGDEITPWYSLTEGKLYFSSNGLVTAGGQDIFYAQGLRKDWKTPVNLAFPANSPADDYYFIKANDLGSGYLVSNRSFGNYKKGTENEDIFKFEYTNYQNLFSGIINEHNTNKFLADARITIFEMFPDGNEKLVDTRFCPDGNFSFALDASKNFKAKIEKFDYAPQFYRFSTSEIKGNKIIHNFSLEPEKEAIVAEDITTKQIEQKNQITINSAKNIKPVNPIETKLPEINGKIEKVKIEEPAIESVVLSSGYLKRPPSFIKEGKYYLIQLAAARYPDLSAKKFQVVTYYGSLEHEPVPDKEMERVLLAWWAEKDEAFKTLSYLKKMGFRNAFVTLHENSVRQKILR